MITNGILGQRLRHRVHRAGGAEPGGDFAIGAGFAARDRLRQLVDPLVEGVDAGQIEGDVGKLAGLAAQQRHDALDRDFDIQWRTRFAGLGIKLIQPAPGFDLARFGQLHAEDTAIAPCDAAPANHRCRKWCTHAPTLRYPPRGEHNTVINGCTWNFGVG